MATVLILPEGGAAPGPGRRVWKAAEHGALVEAGAALDRARQEAGRRLRQAEEAYEERRREGFAAGQAEGKAETAARLLETLASAVDQMAAMERQLVDVVVQSLRTVLGTFDRADLACQVVANALRLVRDEKKILLRVADADAGAVSARIAEIAARYPGIGRVDVSADPSLAPGGCVLETEMGVVDASLERQLAIIEETFRRHLEERRS